MFTVILQDENGNELEIVKMPAQDVKPYIDLIREYGYLDSGSTKREYVEAQVMSEKYVYIDVK